MHAGSLTTDAAEARRGRRGEACAQRRRRRRRSDGDMQEVYARLCPPSPTTGRVQLQARATGVCAGVPGGDVSRVGAAGGVQPA